MAKYNWQQLEQEYILGDYKSLSGFLKEKGIPRGDTAKKKTKDWNDKKSQKSSERVQKTVQKVIEKESTKEANNIVSLNNVANKLLSKIELLSNDVNERNIKSLTSALKDIKDVIDSDFNNDSEKKKVTIINDLPR